MSSADVKIDPAVVAALYVKHAEELRYFLTGLLRDGDLAADVLQVAFARAVELGHTVQEGALKSWLFRVAYNEALAIRRREGVGEKVRQQLAWITPTSDGTPVASVSRFETVVAVRQAIDELPAEQQQVVRMRMYDQKKFAEIAQELKLPLGTVLSRMQLALKKLRKFLRPHGPATDGPATDGPATDVHDQYEEYP